MWPLCIVPLGYGSISSTYYFGFDGSASDSNTRASAQRFCHFSSIFCGSYPDAAAGAPPRIFSSATAAYLLFFLVGSFRVPLLIIRRFFDFALFSPWLSVLCVFALFSRFFLVFPWPEIFFFNAAVIMENPFSAAGACSFNPARDRKSTRLNSSHV